MKDYLVPDVVEQTSRGERSFDIYSRLLKERHHLPRHADRRHGRQPDHGPAPAPGVARTPTRTSTSTSTRPGGDITSLFAIYDTMQFIKPRHRPRSAWARRPRRRRCCWPPGTKGKRFALPHARVLLHQPHGGRATARPSTSRSQAKEILRMRELLEEILAEHTGQTLEKIAQGHRPRLHHDGGRGRRVRHHRRGHHEPKDQAELAAAAAERVVGSDLGRPGRTGRQGDRAAWRSSATRRAAEVLVLRQVAEAGQEAHRRSRRLHLRRVHRPLQRDHRGGALRDLRAQARRAPQAAARSTRSSTTT